MSYTTHQNKENKSFAEFAAMAKDPTTPPEVLAKLAENSLARHQIAEHPDTPLFILEKLAEHKENRVRMRVSHNPSSSTYILDKLSKDPILPVRLEVANHLNTSIATLTILGHDGSIHIRSGVARNPNTPLLVALNALAEDAIDTRFEEVLALHPELDGLPESWQRDVLLDTYSPPEQKILPY